MGGGRRRGQATDRLSAMLKRLVAMVLVVLVTVGVVGAGSTQVLATARGSNSRPASDAGWVLSTTDPTLGVRRRSSEWLPAERIPAEGRYESGPVGPNRRLRALRASAGETERRATVPTWSTFGFSDGTGTFGALPTRPIHGPCSSLPGGPDANQAQCGRWDGYRQFPQHADRFLTTSSAVDLAGRTGHRSALDVIADQARPNLAAVRLRVTPIGAGRDDHGHDSTDGMHRATAVSRSVDLWPMSFTRPWRRGDRIDVEHRVEARRQAQVTDDSGARRRARRPSRRPSRSPFRAGRTYVSRSTSESATSVDGNRGPGQSPLTRARQEAAAAALRFGERLSTRVDHMGTLWHSTSRSLCDPLLTSEARAAMFYLPERQKTRCSGSDVQARSPAGLSSDGYSDTSSGCRDWMYPALLAVHPDIAVGIDTYRQAKLGAAEQYAAESGFGGARFPGRARRADPSRPHHRSGPTSNTSPGCRARPVAVLRSDRRSALAQGRAWPVIRGAADFWASRATAIPSGGYDIDT